MESAILGFYLVCGVALAIGQGRSALKAITLRKAGHGRLRFAQATNPAGYLAVTAFECGLFAVVCVWLIVVVSRAFVP